MDHLINIVPVFLYLLGGTISCGLLVRFAQPSHCGFWEGLLLFFGWVLWVPALAVLSFFAGVFYLASGGYRK
jgi:hypothetical protein